MQYSVPGRPPNTATITAGAVSKTTISTTKNVGMNIAAVPTITLRDESKNLVVKLSSLENTYFYFQEGP